MNPASNPIKSPLTPQSPTIFTMVKTLYFDDKTIMFPSQPLDGTTDVFHVSSHEVIMEANRFFFGQLNPINPTDLGYRSYHIYIYILYIYIHKTL